MCRLLLQIEHFDWPFFVWSSLNLTDDWAKKLPWGLFRTKFQLYHAIFVILIISSIYFSGSRKSRDQYLKFNPSFSLRQRKEFMLIKWIPKFVISLSSLCGFRKNIEKAGRENLSPLKLVRTFIFFKTNLQFFVVKLFVSLV